MLKLMIDLINLLGQIRDLFLKLCNNIVLILQQCLKLNSLGLDTSEIIFQTSLITPNKIQFLFLIDDILMIGRQLVK